MAQISSPLCASHLKCVSFNTDVDWYRATADDETAERFWASDDKTTFCGDTFRILPCTDSSDVLYEITTDSCLSAKNYTVRLTDGTLVSSGTTGAQSCRPRLTATAAQRHNQQSGSLSSTTRLQSIQALYSRRESLPRLRLARVASITS